TELKTYWNNEEHVEDELSNVARELNSP
ncbi:MAG: hypothetical protein JWO94_1761, partial [Verrucomicrobiaceae bacterium]|nr:hypothetical protein [Verrucomicrobiaceae bacterium]